MVVVLLYNSLTYSVLRIFVQKSDINVRCKPFIYAVLTVSKVPNVTANFNILRS